MLNMQEVIKEQVRHRDGSVTFIAMYADQDAGVRVFGIKEPHEAWEFEVFITTEHENPMKVVGRFDLDRVSASALADMTARALEQYKARKDAGGKRLVYKVRS